MKYGQGNREMKLHNIKNINADDEFHATVNLTWEDYPVNWEIIVSFKLLNCLFQATLKSKCAFWIQHSRNANNIFISVDTPHK